MLKVLVQFDTVLTGSFLQVSETLLKSSRVQDSNEYFVETAPD